MNDVLIRETTDDDRTAVLAFLRELWGGEEMVVHDEVVRPAELPGYVAVDRGHVFGLATFRIEADAVELVSLDSLRPSQGVGGALLDRVEREAASRGCASVWLVTTNDNLVALRFYQKRGYRIVRVDPGAVNRARTRKPAIPLVGDDGIPIRDELVLEKSLPGVGQEETG